MITNAVFNITSDIMIIIFPMPLFVQSQLALKRKLVLCGVFALGAFTILAAAMSKYYSLGMPYGGDWIYWYIREVATAIIAANLPMTWTLLQRLFRIGSFNGVYGKSSGLRTGGATGAGVGGTNVTRNGAGKFRSAYGNLSSHGGGGRRGEEDRFEDERTLKNKASALDHELDDISPAESQERISPTTTKLEIYQQKDIHVVVSEAVVTGGGDNSGIAVPAQAHQHGRSVSNSGRVGTSTLVSGGGARQHHHHHQPTKSGAASSTFGVPYATSNSSSGSVNELRESVTKDMGVSSRAYRGV